MIDTKALKDKILDLAMRGKLTPQDPNDEPASELLKRIKAEKEKLINQKKIKREKNGSEIFQGDDGLKYKYGNRHFWCRGYYVDTVGRYEGAIKEYIRNQLQEDIAQDTLNFKEYMDPFTGEQVK